MNKKQTAKPAHTVGPRYGWKSIQQVERGNTIVVSGQETKILSIQQREGCWWVSYKHPHTGAKVEEFYTANAFVYLRFEQRSE